MVKFCYFFATMFRLLLLLPAIKIYVRIKRHSILDLSAGYAFRTSISTFSSSLSQLFHNLVYRIWHCATFFETDHVNLFLLSLLSNAVWSTTLSVVKLFHVNISIYLIASQCLAAFAKVKQMLK